AALDHASGHEEVIAVLDVYMLVYWDLLTLARAAVPANNGVLGRHVDQSRDIGSGHRRLDPVTLLELSSVHEDVESWLALLFRHRDFSLLWAPEAIYSQ